MLASAISCTKASDFDVQFYVPESIELSADSAQSISFKVLAGKSPEQSDRVVFVSSREYTCSITEVGSAKFQVALPKDFPSDSYQVYISRGRERKLMGSTRITITDPGIKLEAGVTVYGRVICDGRGVPGVVVSDGEAVVKTNTEGTYFLKSSKPHGYVFVSVPSGYEVPSQGVLPQLHKQLLKPKDTPEQVDFTLNKVEGQDRYNLLVLGDIHLAGRNNDRQQFAQFTSEVNSYLAAHKGEKTYALTLGDMTWDLYWTSNKYCFEQYLSDVNAIKGLQIFHTIGNHDHEMMATGDFNTVAKYKKEMAPTYYSINLGAWHIVVLDDIECTNNGTGDRTYNCSLVNQELSWLERDLAFVPKTTPIIVTLHAPVYEANGADALTNSSALASILKPYSNVQIITGHTHKMYNVCKDNIYEHNSGAICATWWWTGKLTPGVNICQDGTPGGYRILNIDGNDIKWQYKGTGLPLERQFTSYDRNSMDLSASTYVPKGSAFNQTAFEQLASKWVGSSSDNLVYLNIWDWDPSWTISVQENGQELPVRQVTGHDPIHLTAYSAKRYNTTEDQKSLNFKTSLTTHLFEVQASSATSTLEICVTDRFGRKYTQSMTRPQTFEVSF